jgi:hypothetical protein
MVFKRMWEIFYRQYQYSEFSHSLGQKQTLAKTKKHQVANARWHLIMGYWSSY